MKILIIFAFVHLLYDFILQPREIATTKALKTLSMLQHILMVFAFVYIMLLFFMAPYSAFIVAIINAFFHFIIDTLIWNFYKWKRNYDTTYKFWQDKLWYNCLGIDQFLHLLIFAMLIKFL